MRFLWVAIFQLWDGADKQTGNDQFEVTFPLIQSMVGHLPEGLT